METTTRTERDDILDCLAAFIGQRSGIVTRDYASDWRDKDGLAALRSDQAKIARDGKQARELLASVRRRSITADDLKAALRDAFSGRLSWDGEAKRLDYCTGQYFATEYRAAVCSVLATAMWRYWRSDMPDDCTADDIRRKARAEFGRAIASRWFN